MSHTTENAQRRLLEALAALDSTQWGTASFLLAFPEMIEATRQMGYPEMADTWQALADLAQCVSDDRAAVV